jgi:hypothetical protein
LTNHDNPQSQQIRRFRRGVAENPTMIFATTLFLNDFCSGAFFGQLRKNPRRNGIEASIRETNAQSYPQFLCIRKQFAYSAVS